MVNKRIRSYWLVLLALLMAANMVLSVEPSQAHYINTAAWNTVVEAEENAVASNFLAKASGAPLTVLVGEINLDETPVTFTLDSTRDIAGSLSCSVDKPEYLNVIFAMEEENEAGETIEMTVDPGSEIFLKAGTSTKVIMHMVVTQPAREEAQEPRTLNVTVGWNDTLKGTFCVTLPANDPDSTEPDPTEPEPTEPEPTEPDPTEPEPTEPDPTEPDPTEPDPTEPDPTEPDPTEPDPTEPDPTEPDPTEPNPTEPEETQPVETEPTQPVQETEPVSDTPENSTDTIIYSNDLKKIAVQARAENMRVLHNHILLHTERNDSSAEQAEPMTEQQTDPGLAVPADQRASASVLTTTDPTPVQPDPTEPVPTEPDPVSEPVDPASGEEQSQFRLETIPNFSLNGKLPVKLHLTEEITGIQLGMGTGADTEIKPFPAHTCYSLDNGKSFYMLYQDSTIALDPEDSTLTVLLDLARVELPEAESLTLVANGYKEEILLNSAIVTTAPNTETFCQIDSQFLTRGSSVNITLNENWKAYTFDYTVQLLTGSDTGSKKPENVTPAYEDVDASLWSKLIADEQNYKLAFQINEVLPPAGTYRVRMNWSHDGICFAQEQAVFFINYSVYSESEGTGGTEQ